MAEWPESRQLASQYHSSSPTGIGFAQYASTGTVTPELWENIKHIEAETERRPEDPAVEGWAEDMERLRELLRTEGITEKRKVKLQISFTEVIPRSVEVEVELDPAVIEDLESGYGGFSDREYAEMVQEACSAQGERIGILHDEVDHIEVLDPQEEEQ